MASRQGEILLNTFLEAAGGEWRGVAMDDLLALLAAALEETGAERPASAAGTASREHEQRGSSRRGQRVCGRRRRC